MRMILQKFLEIGVGQGIFVPDLGTVCHIYSSLIFWPNPRFSGDGFFMSSTWNSTNRPFQGKHPKNPRKGRNQKDAQFNFLFLPPFFPHKVIVMKSSMTFFFTFFSVPFSDIEVFCSRLLVRGHGTQPVSSLEKMCPSVGRWPGKASVIPLGLEMGSPQITWALDLPLSLNWAVLMVMSKWAIHNHGSPMKWRANE